MDVLNADLSELTDHLANTNREAVKNGIVNAYDQYSRKFANYAPSSVKNEYLLKPKVYIMLGTVPLNRTSSVLLVLFQTLSFYTERYDVEILLSGLPSDLSKSNFRGLFKKSQLDELSQQITGDVYDARILGRSNIEENLGLALEAIIDDVAKIPFKYDDIVFFLGKGHAFGGGRSCIFIERMLPYIPCRKIYLMLGAKNPIDGLQWKVDYFMTPSYSGKTKEELSKRLQIDPRRIIKRNNLIAPSIWENEGSRASLSAEEEKVIKVASKSGSFLITILNNYVKRVSDDFVNEMRRLLTNVENASYIIVGASEAQVRDNFNVGDTQGAFYFINHSKNVYAFLKYLSRVSTGCYVNPNIPGGGWSIHLAVLCGILPVLFKGGDSSAVYGDVYTVENYEQMRSMIVKGVQNTAYRKRVLAHLNKKIEDNNASVVSFYQNLMDHDLYPKMLPCALS